MNTNITEEGCVCLAAQLKLTCGGRDKEKCVRACVCDKWDYINCLPACLHIETDLFHLNVMDRAGSYEACFEQTA